MRARVEDFLAHLKHNPLPTIQGDNAYIVTHTTVKTFIHIALYAPVQLWPLLAYVLDSLMKRDPGSRRTAMQTFVTRHHGLSEHFSPTLPFNIHQSSILQPFSIQDFANDLPGQYAWHLETAISILCGDGEPFAPSNVTKSSFLQYNHFLRSQSPLIGGIWSEITLPCRHWRSAARPSNANVFRGPFRSNLSDYHPHGSPILFIGNTADPVTPVDNAYRMSAMHEGSVVLTQDMPGHCAGASNPSTCLFGVVKRFFATGKLPEPGTVCGPAVKPWGLQ
jgi:hypothetical protein